MLYLYIPTYLKYIFLSGFTLIHNFICIHVNILTEDINELFIIRSVVEGVKLIYRGTTNLKVYIIIKMFTFSISTSVASLDVCQLQIKTFC